MLQTSPLVFIYGGYTKQPQHGKQEATPSLVQIPRQPDSQKLLGAWTQPEGLRFWS